MAISFQKALGIHEQAMLFRGKRAEVLANNLINADTPHYKARDVDFRAVLGAQVSGGVNATLRSTHHRHMNPVGTAADPQLLYRTPLQPSLDGNTVDEQVEMTRFAKNAMDFQASFHFLNSKFKGLSRAIKGEA